MLPCETSTNMSPHMVIASSSSPLEFLNMENEIHTHRCCQLTSNCHCCTIQAIVVASRDPRTATVTWWPTPSRERNSNLRARRRRSLMHAVASSSSSPHEIVQPMLSPHVSSPSLLELPVSVSSLYSITNPRLEEM